MATALEIAKFLFGAAGQSSPGKRAGVLAGGGNTTVRYGTVKTVDGTSVTILMEDTGETLYTMTTTPVAVGDRVAIIKNGQSVIVYATDQIVEMINKTVVDGDAEYAVGDDAYTVPKNGWSTTMPEVGQGEYLWMRYTTTLQDGTVKTSTPVCLTSAGVKIDRVRDMYYLSTSETQVIGGTWVYDECPEWQEGRYIWTRMEITYDDGSVYLSDPVLMSALNQANEGVAKINWHFWTDDDGAHVTENENTVQTGANALLAGNMLVFRSGLTELMKIAAALIELGKNSKGARISFCGGTGYIDSGETYNPSGAVSNDGMCLHSDGGILLANGPSDRLGSSDQWVALQEDGTLQLYPSGIVINIPNTSDGRRVGELDDWITDQGKEGMWNWRVYASGYRDMVGNIQLTFPANSGNNTAVTFPGFCSFNKYTDYSVFCQIIGTNDSGSNYFNHLSVMPIEMGPTGFSLHTWNDSNTTVYYRVSVRVAGWDK